MSPIKCLKKIIYNTFSYLAKLHFETETILFTIAKLLSHVKGTQPIFYYLSTECTNIKSISSN
jgi:hypothetical protein